MSGASSYTCLSSNFEENIERELWLDTYYFDAPLDILTNPNSTFEGLKMTPTYFFIYLNFRFQRISDLHFKIVCSLDAVGDYFPIGNYTIQFYYDFNISDDDTKVLEIQYDGTTTVAEDEFTLESYREYLSLNEVGKRLELKILVKMIEYDRVSTDVLHVDQLNYFRVENQHIFSNESLLRNFYFILNVEKFEDLFKGRQKYQFMFKRRKILTRTAPFSEQIARYLRSTTPPSIDLEAILNYIFHEKRGKISFTDLVTDYKEAHHLGLNCLIELLRDCLLNKLAEYDAESLSKYEDCMFAILKEAVNVNDGSFFDKALTKLNKSEESLITENLRDKFEDTTTATRFVIHFSQRRIKKLESNDRIEIGEASSSKDL